MSTAGVILFSLGTIAVVVLLVAVIRGRLGWAGLRTRRAATWALAGAAAVTFTGMGLGAASTPVTPTAETRPTATAQTTRTSPAATHASATDRPTTAASATHHPRAHRRTVAGLLIVHDPGQVTGTLTGPCHARDHGRLPDRSCTPGAVDPAVSRHTLAATICRTGYTTTVRPPESATDAFEWDDAVPAYGYGNRFAGELDHLVPLELGGANDAANLWPEAGAIPNGKDEIEATLHAAVCDRRVGLRAAQRAISGDWETAEARLGLTSTHTHAPTRAPTRTHRPAPATSRPTPSGVDEGVVHPGAFCSPEGATGHTNAGTPMVCKPASDGRNRWQAAR